MERHEIIKKRNECWANVEFLQGVQGKMKDKDKSVYYLEMIKKEKFKYKIYNGLLKNKNRCD